MNIQQTPDSPIGEIFTVAVGHGRPLILLHGGLGLDHTYLRPWLDPLADAFQLIYYDHRGNGRSLVGPDDLLSHEVWVRDVDAVRGSTGHERVFIFGHSYGGYLALEYAIRHPDRVAGLILMATAPAVDYAEAILAEAQRRGTARQNDALLALLAQPVANDDSFRAMWDDIAPLYFHDDCILRNKLPFADVRFRARGFNAGMFDCIPQFNVVGDLHRITAPTLILSGDDDFINPPKHTAHRLRDGIPNAVYHELGGCGHFPFIEMQGRCLQVITEWLRQCRQNIG